jgi:hypothetical protein
MATLCASGENVNWEAIGAIAELAAALVVVATLVYLALQIRQNSSLARADLFYKAQAQFSLVRSMVNEHPHVFKKMIEQESLTTEEMIVANNIAGEIAFSYATFFENCKIVAPNQLNGAVDGCLAAFDMIPGFYESTKTQLTVNGYGEFVEQLDKKRVEGGT